MNICKCGHGKESHNDFNQCCIIIGDETGYLFGKLKVSLGFKTCSCKGYEELENA